MKKSVREGWVSVGENRYMIMGGGLVWIGGLRIQRARRYLTTRVARMPAVMWSCTAQYTAQLPACDTSTSTSCAPGRQAGNGSQSRVGGGRRALQGALRGSQRSTPTAFHSGHRQDALLSATHVHTPG